MKIEFNLHKGMTPKEIFAELKGRVSGETRQEMQQFYQRVVDVREADDDGVLRLGPTHEIVASDGEYAVIRRNDGSFYFCGINDEGKYFVHRMDGAPFSFAMDMTSMEPVLNWVNRVDEGFVMRVQGDILIQFVPKHWLHQERSSNYWSFIPEPPSVLHSDSYFVGLHKSVRLGNHNISTDGEIFSQTSLLTLVLGTQVVLQHPEHGIKTVDIPKDHMAVLAGQNGRFGVAFD